MKQLLLILLPFIPFFIFSQEWTKAQKTKAATANSVTTLSAIEKDVIMNINLARLYPKQFAKLAIKDYTGPSYGADMRESPYKKSLLAELDTMKAVSAIVFDKDLYDNAKCLAVEQNMSGAMGHKRVKCVQKSYYECLMYGDLSAQEIVVLWLIDHNEKSLGHRRNCLQKRISKTGICENPHKKTRRITVAEFI